MDGDNFRGLTPDEIKERIERLDMAIIGAENTDRLGFDGMERLDQMKRDRRALRDALQMVEGQ